MRRFIATKTEGTNTMTYKELSPTGKIKKAIIIDEDTHEAVDITELCVTMQKLEHQQRKINKLLAKEAR